MVTSNIEPDVTDQQPGQGKVNTCGIAAIEDLTARGVRFGDMLGDDGLPYHGPEGVDMFRRYIRAFSVGQWVRTDAGWTMTIPGNLGGNIWFHNRAPRLFGAIPKQVLIDFMKQTPFDLPTLAPGSDDDLLGTLIVGTWRKPSFTMDPPALTYQVEFIYARPKPDRYEGDKPADYASGNEVCGSH